MNEGLVLNNETIQSPKYKIVIPPISNDKVCQIYEYIIFLLLNVENTILAKYSSIF